MFVCVCVCSEEISRLEKKRYVDGTHKNAHVNICIHMTMHAYIHRFRCATHAKNVK